MDTASILVIVMFLSSMGLLMVGFPVAFTLGGTAIIFAAIGVLLDAFSFSLIGAFPQRVFGILTTNVLIAAPLFIFMGVMLHCSAVAEDLLVNIGRLFGRVRGGMGLAVTIVGMLLAASTGVIGATVVTLGLLSLPVMLKHNYDVRLASGTICAAGTLGQIIPPSLVLVFLGDFLGFANQQAQFKTMNFDSGTVGVVELFAGALIPGLVLVLMYLVYQVCIGWLRPEVSPAITRSDDAPTGGMALKQLLMAVAAPLGLIVGVLGSILAGIATPTEAAAVGATGAIFLASARQSGSGGRQAMPYYAAGIATIGLVVLIPDTGFAAGPRGHGDRRQDRHRSRRAADRRLGLGPGRQSLAGLAIGYSGRSRPGHRPHNQHGLYGPDRRHVVYLDVPRLWWRGIGS